MEGEVRTFLISHVAFSLFSSLRSFRKFCRRTNPVYRWRGKASKFMVGVFQMLHTQLEASKLRLGSRPIRWKFHLGLVNFT